MIETLRLVDPQPQSPVSTQDYKPIHNMYVHIYVPILKVESGVSRLQNNKF